MAAEEPPLNQIAERIASQLRSDNTNNNVDILKASAEIADRCESHLQASLRSSNPKSAFDDSNVWLWLHVFKQWTSGSVSQKSHNVMLEIMQNCVEQLDCILMPLLYKTLYRFYNWLPDWDKTVESFISWRAAYLALNYAPGNFDETLYEALVCPELWHVNRAFYTAVCDQMISNHNWLSDQNDYRDGSLIFLNELGSLPGLLCICVHPNDQMRKVAMKILEPLSHSPDAYKRSKHIWARTFTFIMTFFPPETPSIVQNYQICMDFFKPCKLIADNAPLDFLEYVSPSFVLKPLLLSFHRAFQCSEADNELLLESAALNLCYRFFQLIPKEYLIGITNRSVQKNFIDGIVNCTKFRQCIQDVMLEKSSDPKSITFCRCCFKTIDCLFRTLTIRTAKLVLHSIKNAQDPTTQCATLLQYIATRHYWPKDDDTLSIISNWTPESSIDTSLPDCNLEIYMQNIIMSNKELFSRFCSAEFEKDLPEIHSAALECFINNLQSYLNRLILRRAYLLNLKAVDNVKRADGIFNLLELDEFVSNLSLKSKEIILLACRKVSMLMEIPLLSDNMSFIIEMNEASKSVQKSFSDFLRKAFENESHNTMERAPSVYFAWSTVVAILFSENSTTRNTAWMCLAKRTRLEYNTKYQIDIIASCIKHMPIDTFIAYLSVTFIFKDENLTFKFVWNFIMISKLLLRAWNSADTNSQSYQKFLEHMPPFHVWEATWAAYTTIFKLIKQWKSMGQAYTNDIQNDFMELVFQSIEMGSLTEWLKNLQQTPEMQTQLENLFYVISKSLDCSDSFMLTRCLVILNQLAGQTDRSLISHRCLHFIHQKVRNLKNNDPALQVILRQISKWSNIFRMEDGSDLKPDTSLSISKPLLATPKESFPKHKTTTPTPGKSKLSSMMSNAIAAHKSTYTPNITRSVPPKKPSPGEKLIIDDRDITESYARSSSSSSSDLSDDPDDEEGPDFLQKVKANKSANTPKREIKLLSDAEIGNVIKSSSRKLHAASDIQKQDFQLKLSEKIEKFKLNILKWSITNKKPDLPRPLKKLDLQYLSCEDYISAYESPLYLELWESIQQGRTMLTKYDVKEAPIVGRSTEDSLTKVVISFENTNQDAPNWSENDVVLIHRQKEPLLYIDEDNTEQTRPMMAIVTATFRRNGYRDFNLSCIPPGPKSLETLDINNTVYCAQVCSLIPFLREFQALHSIDQYKLKDVLLGGMVDENVQNIDRASIVEIKHLYGLNDSQANAVAVIDNQTKTSKEGFTLIQGPPGTGKTKTILSIISQYLFDIDKSRPGTIKESKSKRILVTAPSNAAVDEIVLRLKHGIRVNLPSACGIDQCLKPAAIRLGKSDSIQQAVMDMTLDYKLEAVLPDGSSNDKDLYEKELGLRKKLDEISALREKLFSGSSPSTSSSLNFTQGDSEHGDREEQLKNLKEQRTSLQYELANTRNRRKTIIANNEKRKREKAQEILRNCQVFCTTLSGSAHEVIENLKFTFDLIIIDEAAQAVELSTLIPLKYNCKRCVLVGDPNQLPPTVLSQVACSFSYEQSLFVRLQSKHPKSVHLLDTQYRMHSMISRIPSLLFYDSKIQDGPTNDNDNRRPWHIDFKLLSPYRFFDLKSSTTKSGARPSYKNYDEVKFIVKLFSELKRQYPQHDFKNKIGILTPYKAQVLELKQAFERKFGKRIFEEISCNTVDGFQGQEKDIVFFSCVRASQTEGIGFVSDIRRMNVALTRAKSTLYVIGNADALLQNPYWKRLILETQRLGLFTPTTLDDALTLKPSMKRKSIDEPQSALVKKASAMPSDQPSSKDPSSRSLTAKSETKFHSSPSSDDLIPLSKLIDKEELKPLNPIKRSQYHGNTKLTNVTNENNENKNQSSWYDKSNSNDKNSIQIDDEDLFLRAKSHNNRNDNPNISHNFNAKKEQKVAYLPGPGPVKQAAQKDDKSKFITNFSSLFNFSGSRKKPI